MRGVLASCDQSGQEYGVDVLIGQPIVQPSFAPLGVVEKRPERSFRTAAAPCLWRTTFRISQSSIPSRSTSSRALAIGPSVPG